jgi:HYDIN/CFA65/VesB family protein
VDIEIDGRATFQAAYGTARADTQGDCGDIDNGFGLLFNWNLLGDGTSHRVRVLADGVEVAASTFAVTTLGLGQFPQGLTGTGTISDFPQVGRSTHLQWQESLQNFSIITPNSSPQLTVSPTTLDFGNVIVGQNSERTFTVTNSGGETLTGGVSASAPFSIVSGGTLNIGAGQGQTVTVRFSPTSPGSSSGTVAISSNGGSGSVAVSGVGGDKTGPYYIMR